MHVAREHSTSLSQVRCHDIRVVAPHTSASTLPSRKTHLQLIAYKYNAGAVFVKFCSNKIMQEENHMPDNR